MTKTELTAMLTAKDDKIACAFTEKIIAESRETDEWYAYFDVFAPLLSHSKSYVRNRSISLLAVNARWDEENRLDGVLTELLSHITDEKPITARQCVKALAEVGRAKPHLVPAILTALNDADLSQYRDSMCPLIEKDIRETAGSLTEVLAAKEN